MIMILVALAGFLVCSFVTVALIIQNPWLLLVVVALFALLAWWYRARQAKRRARREAISARVASMREERELRFAEERERVRTEFYRKRAQGR